MSKYAICISGTDEIEGDDIALNKVTTVMNKRKNGVKIAYPTKFQRIFSALYSPSLPYDRWFDLVKRNNDRQTKPIFDDSNVNEISNDLNTKSPIRFIKPLGEKDETGEAKGFVWNDINSSSARDTEASEDERYVNVGTDENHVGKRPAYDCDISKATLNMLVEYFKHKTICGKKASKVRFGLGK